MVGLEDEPCILYDEDEDEGEGEVAAVRVAALDGFSISLQDAVGGEQGRPTTYHWLDLSSAATFVKDVQTAIPTSSDPPQQQEQMEDDAHEHDDEDEDPQYMNRRSLALGIDSLDMLAHRLGGMSATMNALRGLLKKRRHTDTLTQTPPFFGPILTVLHSFSSSSSSISPAWHKALEDLATTNIYIQPHDETRGRCFILRRSASGKVQEEWESYELQLLERESSGGGEGATRRRRRRRSQKVKVVFASSSLASASSIDKKAGERNGSGLAAAGGGRKEKKEAAFLESLPFRLSLNEQEKAMRGQTVLPHERQQAGQPLIYHEDEGEDYDEEGEEEEEEEEDESDEDSDIDDDLDI